MAGVSGITAELDVEVKVSKVNRIVVLMATELF